MYFFFKLLFFVGNWSFEPISSLFAQICFSSLYSFIATLYGPTIYDLYIIFEKKLAIYYFSTSVCLDRTSHRNYWAQAENVNSMRRHVYLFEQNMWINIWVCERVVTRLCVVYCDWLYICVFDQLYGSFKLMMWEATATIPVWIRNTYI